MELGTEGSTFVLYFYCKSFFTIEITDILAGAKTNFDKNL